MKILIQDQNQDQDQGKERKERKEGAEFRKENPIKNMLFQSRLSENMNPLAFNNKNTVIK